jgi:hypothetical protein
LKELIAVLLRGGRDKVVLVVGGGYHTVMDTVKMTGDWTWFEE